MRPFVCARSRSAPVAAGAVLARARVAHGAGALGHHPLVHRARLRERCDNVGLSSVRRTHGGPSRFLFSTHLTSAGGRPTHMLRWWRVLSRSFGMRRAVRTACGGALHLVCASRQLVCFFLSIFLLSYGEYAPLVQAN